MGFFCCLFVCLFVFLYACHCPAGNILCLWVILHYTECFALSAYIQILHHLIHKLCVTTTLKNYKWHWTLRLSLCYYFICPAVKTRAFAGNYHNPAHKLALASINNFPMLCHSSVHCADQNLDHNHECYQTSYQGFPHSKQFIIGPYPEFWNFEPSIIFYVIQLNYMFFEYISFAEELITNSTQANFKSFWVFSVL